MTSILLFGGILFVDSLSDDNARASHDSTGAVLQSDDPGSD